MTITVQIKSVYGNEMIYPICNTAKLLADLTGKKTLTRSAIDQIKALGYTIEVANQTL